MFHISHFLKLLIKGTLDRSGNPYLRLFNSQHKCHSTCNIIHHCTFGNLSTLLDTFSIKDNIFLPLVLAKKPVAEMKKRLTPLAEMLGIAGILEKYPYEVSGGQKQRAAVARALITKPDLILADEPTGALDSRSTDSLLAVFEEINRKGQTILMVTHSIKAASHAGRVLFIKDGTVFHQIYRGELQREAMYQKISDTLTLLTTGGNSHE